LRWAKSSLPGRMCVQLTSFLLLFVINKPQPTAAFP